MNLRIMSSACLVLVAGFVSACASSTTCPQPAHAPRSKPAATLATSVEPGPAEVRSAEASPKRTAPHGNASVVLLARGENAFIGRLEMVAFAKVPEHQDPTEEYIHVLSGHGRLTMNGESFEISAGTTIYMPAFATVSYENGDQPFVGIQVFAGPSPADKYETWQ
jgi:quercetin dioxygenase-like cupin family protein